MDEIDLKSIMVDKKNNEIETKQTQSIQPIQPISKDFQQVLHNIKKQNDKPKTIKEIKPVKESKQKEEKEPNLSIDRRRTILILQMYINEFPDKLKTFKNTNFEKKKDEELKKLKNEFDFIIGCKNNIKSAEYCCIRGVNLLEVICCNYTPIQCQGLSTAVNDEDFRDDVKHLCLKYMSLIKTEPEHRIAYKIASNMLLLHQVNSIKNQSNNFNINEIHKINNKYEAL